MTIYTLEDQIRPKITKKDILFRGTIIGIIVTIPSLTAFFISWFITDNVFMSAIIGAVVHFIAMGFSFKISKRFFIKTKQ